MKNNCTHTGVVMERVRGFTANRVYMCECGTLLFDWHNPMEPLDGTELVVDPDLLDSLISDEINAKLKETGDKILKTLRDYYLIFDDEE